MLVSSTTVVDRIAVCSRRDVLLELRAWSRKFARPRLLPPIPDKGKPDESLGRKAKGHCDAICRAAWLPKGRQSSLVVLNSKTVYPPQKGERGECRSFCDRAKAVAGQARAVSRQPRARTGSRELFSFGPQRPGGPYLVETVLIVWRLL